MHPTRLWDRAPGLLEQLRAQGPRPISIEQVLDGADREARALSSPEPPLGAMELPVEAGFGWDPADTADRRWYPQGISSSHDASPDGLWHGREIVVVSWALDNHAAIRVSFAEFEAGRVRRYRHVLLGEPVCRPWERRVWLRPVRVHAGGIAWAGSHLWVADTIRGLRAFAVDEMLELPGGELLMPQVGAHRLRLVPALLARGPRFSFVSLQRPLRGEPSLVSGEYRDKRPGARIVRWPLPDTGGNERPAPIRASAGFAARDTNLQAVLGIDDRLVTVSSAGRRPGILAVHREGESQPAASHRWATGPEDLTLLPARDLLMSLTERPPEPGCAGCGRVVFGVRASAVLGG